MADSKLVQTIRHNCDISDALDNGIYSICVLVLKLRNLYKWEHDIEPWEEPESGILLDWIDAKEKYWKTIAEDPYRPLTFRGREHDPFELAAINSLLADDGLIYGAGYGRSLKTIFFLAEKIREESVEGCPVVILGRETARELSSPFAMLQDGAIIIRRDPMRFFSGTISRKCVHPVKLRSTMHLTGTVFLPTASSTRIFSGSSSIPLSMPRSRSLSIMRWVKCGSTPLTAIR